MPRRSVWAALTALAVVVMLVLSPHRAVADERDFILINGGDSVITEVYVSSSNNRSWEDDILDPDELYPGESVTIRFSRYDGEAGVCLYDVRVVAEDGGQGILTLVDLCTTATVTFVR